jgi:hypothetical protein
MNRFGISFLFTALLLLGCGGGVTLTERPLAETGATTLSKGSQNRAPIGYIKTIAVVLDGTERTPLDNFIFRVRGKFRETNLFHEVIFNKPSFVTPSIELELTIKEDRQLSENMNVLKTMASGLTVGLLAPLLPLEGSYAGEMRLKVTRSDGEERNYLARCAGTAKAYISLANFSQVWTTLTSTVTSNNLNSLASQMVRDAEFYRLESMGTERKPPL